MRIGGIYKIYSMHVRGKYGRGGGFGRICFGYNFLGFYSKFSGIWQRRYYYGKPYLSKAKFSRPTNPQTVPQQNWRAVCAYGWVIWAALSTFKKAEYEELGKSKQMSGANAFMSWWLKNPTSGLGNTFCGYNRFGCS